MSSVKLYSDSAPLALLEAEVCHGEAAALPLALEEGPKLPTPVKSRDGFTFTDDVSLIAVLGKIAALVTEQDTHFRQIMWDQDTQFMQFTVKMGQTLHDTIVAQGEAQAKAIDEDAKMARTGGMIMFSAGIIGGVLGCVQAYSEMKAAGKAVVGQNAENAALAGRRGAAGAAGDAAAGGVAGAGGAPLAERLSWAARTKNKIGSVMNTVGQVTKYVSGTVGAAEMMAQGSKALFVDAPCNTDKANDTRDASKKEADKQQIEVYQNFWNQSHQRGEQAVSGTDQNHANTLRTYTSAVEASTQAVVSGWNRI